MKSFLILFCTFAMLAGCSGGERIVPDRPAERAPVSGASNPQSSASEPAAVAELPALGDAVKVDDGRLSVAGPADWVRPPRDPKWLARFEMTSGTPYPAILVPPAAESDFANVTKENAAEFARHLQAELQQELSAQGYKVPEVKPLVLEHFAGAEYSRQAKVQGRNVQLNRLYLVTVAGGRKYTVEMHALFGTQATFRPHALAVADGLRFLASESGATDEK